MVHADLKAQFTTKYINVEETKYNCAVTALEQFAAKAISAFLCAPPATNKHTSLKTLLIRTYGLTQVEKDAHVLAILGFNNNFVITLFEDEHYADRAEGFTLG